MTVIAASALTLLPAPRAARADAEAVTNAFIAVISDVWTLDGEVLYYRHPNSRGTVSEDANNPHWRAIAPGDISVSGIAVKTYMHTGTGLHNGQLDWNVNLWTYGSIGSTQNQLAASSAAYTVDDEDGNPETTIATGSAPVFNGSNLNYSDSNSASAHIVVSPNQGIDRLDIAVDLLVQARLISSTPILVGDPRPR